MYPRHNSPYSSLSPLELFDAALTIASRFTQEMENIERRNRNDDNMVKMVSQATRLYEQGAINKEQLITIISQLPNNRPPIESTIVNTSSKSKPTAQDLIDLLNQM